MRSMHFLQPHKAAQIPCLDLAADIPQSADAVEEGVFFMGDPGDLIFLICNSSHFLSF